MCFLLFHLWLWGSTSSKQTNTVFKDGIIQSEAVPRLQGGMLWWRVACVTASDRVTAAWQDAAVITALLRRHPWQCLTGCPSVCLSVCLPGHTLGAQTHRYTKTHLALRLMSACLSDIYARTLTVNKLAEKMPRCSDFSFGSTSPPTNGGN